MHLFKALLLSVYAANAFAQSSTTTGGTTSITGCHTHGTDIFCRDDDGNEVLVSATATPTAGIPAQYTNCHSHGSETYCNDSDGNEVLVQEEETEHDHERESEHNHESESEHDHESESEHNHESESEQYTNCHSHGSETYCMNSDGNEVLVQGGKTEHNHESGHNHSEESEGGGKTNCHFHAGVEHCVSEGESEESSHQSCGIQTRDYDVPLRIGSLFVVLVTSSIGVFAPIVLAKLPFKTVNTVASTIIKQFGTGIIIATAYIHLYTHATLMFTNDCLGELGYEATTSAVVMAGVFLAFLFEYVGHRIIVARGCTTPDPNSQDPSHKESPSSGMLQPQSNLAHLGHSHGDPTMPNTKFSVIVMEAGIIFHSVLIGVTLVVAGDSFYKTLLVVIIFHQFFEGLALGARIATLPGAILSYKAIMAGAFALITPIGMAIGLGVLHSFNGNEASTLVALGTLDAVSAGILVWVGVVDMWARDWVIEGGEMLNATWGKVTTGGLSMVTGLVLMGLLGKWA